MLRGVSATCVVALAMCAAGSADAALRFRFVQLAGASTGGTLEAKAISDNGHIVGTFTSSRQFLYQGLYWPDAQQPPIPITGEGDDVLIAMDVNSAGTVVGGAGEGTLAFFWNAGADLVTLENLVTCFSCNSGAAAINEGGIIVGASTFPSGAVHAVRWINDGIEDLGAMDGDCCSYGNAINSAGIICGSSETKAVMWTGSLIVDLEAPTDASNVALAINSNDFIVGERYVNGPFFPTRPFLWSDGAVQDLGTLGDEHVSGSAKSINDQGWIVGYSYLQLPPSAVHACLWKGGQLVDLNGHVVDMSGGWYLEVAADINNANQIVGSGWFGNQKGAFFLDPIPPADINADGAVNATDLLAALNAWGLCSAAPVCAADVNDDGVVNVADLLAIINNWS